MRTLFFAAACAGVALGARHFRRFMTGRGKNRLLEKKIEVWEGEGGAVPIHETRTAAQVSPRSSPPLSSRDVN